MRPTHAGTFHVTTRSIAEEHIFRDDRDYHAGVQILAELTGERFMVCHEFCLMPTHYHVLASFQERRLTAAIRRLNRRYASGFNRRHRRRGHVFDSPVTAVEVLTERHAYRLLDYIEENRRSAPGRVAASTRTSPSSCRRLGSKRPNLVRLAESGSRVRAARRARTLRRIRFEVRAPSRGVRIAPTRSSRARDPSPPGCDPVS